MVGVEPTGCVEPTFDLTVEGAHEFFANGVLVHNSTDCLIYARKLVAKMFESGTVVQEDSGDGPKGADANYADPMGLGDDVGDGELGAGHESAFDSWMHGQNNDDWSEP